MPVAELMPSVYDIFTDAGAPLPQHPCSLYPPGLAPLDLSMSLSQLGIVEGSLLVLAPATSAAPPIQLVHTADAVQDAAGASRRQWTTPQSRLAALLITTTLAATIGVAAVPGRVGVPSLLLGAASATAVAAIAARVTHHGRTALLATTTAGALVTAATFGATLFDIHGPATGVTLAVLSVVVLSVPGRLVVTMAGLSAYIGPDLDPDADGPDGEVWRRSARAQQFLTALVVGASATATLGGAAVALGADRQQLPAYLVAAALAALLTIRSRVHHHPVRRLALLVGGLLCTTTLLIGMRLGDPGLAPWLCGAATLLALGALWLGFAPPLAAHSAPVRRCLDLLDCLLLVAVIPLACWSSGLYAIVRGLSL
ncbi:type VII secretion integral membrane protein EccD [soil metagenome]